MTYPPLPPPPLVHLSSLEVKMDQYLSYLFIEVQVEAFRAELDPIGWEKYDAGFLNGMI